MRGSNLSDCRESLLDEGITMHRNRPSLVLFAGILILVSPALAAPPEPLVLGGDDSAEVLLLVPRQVEEGPDANLYVLDQGDATIKVYSPAGEFLRQLAGEGEGPGLIRRADGATIGFRPDGTLYITEIFGGHRWLTILAPDGDLVDTLHLDLAADFGVEAAAPLTGGGFLVQIAYGPTPRPSGDYYLYDLPQALVRLDDQGAVLTEIVRTDNAQMISFSPNGGTSNLPFTPTFAWAVQPDSTIVWSDGMSPVLQVYDQTGKLVRDLATGLPAAEKVSEAELETWQRNRREQILDRNPDWWQRFGRVVEAYDHPLYDKPIFSSLSVTPAGHLLAEGSWQPGEEEITYWLLAPDGEVLATVAARAAKLHLSAHYVLYLTADDEGTPLVHVLPRPQDDPAALAMAAAAAR